MTRITCARMLCFLVVPGWTAVVLFVAGVVVSPSTAGLMEFALGRASDTWDVPVLSAATRSTTRQQLFHVMAGILVQVKYLKKKIKTTKVGERVCVSVRSVRPGSVHVTRLSSSEKEIVIVMRPGLCCWDSEMEWNDCHPQSHLQTQSPMWRETIGEPV